MGEIWSMLGALFAFGSLVLILRELIVQNRRMRPVIWDTTHTATRTYPDENDRPEYEVTITNHGRATAIATHIKFVNASKIEEGSRTMVFPSGTPVKYWISADEIADVWVYIMFLHHEENRWGFATWSAVTMTAPLAQEMYEQSRQEARWWRQLLRRWLPTRPVGPGGRQLQRIPRTQRQQRERLPTAASIATESPGADLL